LSATLADLSFPLHVADFQFVVMSVADMYYVVADKYYIVADLYYVVELQNSEFSGDKSVPTYLKNTWAKHLGGMSTIDALVVEKVNIGGFRDCGSLTQSQYSFF